MALTDQRISNILGVPFLAVQSHWPLVVSALQEQGIGSEMTQIAALATIGTEVPKFEPINEMGGDGYFTRIYGHRTDLGNVEPGDGAKYHGRGFIQLTGRANYARYGNALGLDLEGEPDLALTPDVAARVLALFFKTMKVDRAANEQDWIKVRRLVNGGLNGWERFHSLVSSLTRAVLEVAP